MTGRRRRQPPDPWSRWFDRLVQVVGVLAFVWQLASAELTGRAVQPWLLLFTGSLILGSVGLRPLLRGMRNWLMGALDDDHSNP